MNSMSRLFLAVALFALCSLAEVALAVLGTDSTVTNTQATCSDGTTSGFQQGTDADSTCYCACSDGGDKSCLTLRDISAKYETLLSTGTVPSALEMIVRTCVADGLTEAECRGDKIPPSLATCADICPICDETAICEKYDGAYDCMDGACYQFRCTSSTDSRGNVLAVIERVQQLDDSQLFCANTCGSDRDYNASAPEPCTEPIVGDDGCYYPCAEQELQGALSLERAIGDADALRRLIDFCIAINPSLEGCPLGKIVPGGRDGCGCPVCLDECPLEEAFFLREGVCYRKFCAQTAITAEDSTLSGSLEQYVNTLCECGTEEVDVARCEDAIAVPPPPPPADVDCEDPCSSYDIRHSVCFETPTGELVTHHCPEENKCAMMALMEEGLSEEELRVYFTLVSYGECGDDSTTTSPCTVGEIIVGDERAPNSKCPYLEVCVPFAAGEAGFVRTTIEEALPKLTEFCFGGSEVCTADRLAFFRCPLTSDASICSSFLCDAEKDPNDDTQASFVCHLSAEGFTVESSGDARLGDARVTDAETGCIYNGCVDDVLTPIPYTTGDVLDPLSRLAVNCRLEDCVNGITTNDLCGKCPSCLNPPDPCARADLDFEAPCIEDPLEDPTRPDDDPAIAGRCRLRVPLKFCADQFLGMSREEIYAALKTAALRLAEGCDAVDVFEYLRTAITQFDVSVITSDDSDCAVMVAVLIQLDFTDIDLDRLRALKECLEETGLDVRLRAAIQAATTSVGLSGEATMPEVVVDAASAVVEVTDAAGTTSLVFTVQTTADGATTADGGSDPGLGDAGGSQQAFIGLGAVFVMLLSALF